MSAKLPLDRSSALLVAIGLTAVLMTCSLMFLWRTKKKAPACCRGLGVVPALWLGRDYPPAEAGKEYAYEEVSRHRTPNPTASAPTPSCHSATNRAPGGG